MPRGPYTAWLEELYAQAGTWKQVAAMVGIDQTQLNATAESERVTVRIVRRSAERAGTTLEAIYGLAQQQLAA